MARFTDEFRASAVLMLEAAGYPQIRGALVRTAKELKISHQVLHRWYWAKQNPPPQEVVQIKKEEIIDLLKKEILAALRDMPDARQDADYRALNTGIGIMIEKWQLLEGAATARYDNLSWEDHAIADIKAGQVNYQDLANAFDTDLATRLFAKAGVSVQVTEDREDQ